MFKEKPQTYLSILGLLLAFIVGTFFAPSLAFAENTLRQGDYYTNSDGTLVILSLDADAVTSAKELIQQFQSGNFVKVSLMVNAPTGQVPQMVISGDASDVQQALDLIQRLLPTIAQKHLVVISASLRQFARSDSRNVGLNIIPDTLAGTVTGTVAKTLDATNTSSLTKSGTGTLTATYGDILKLDNSMSWGKVLVASEVYARNGNKAEIANVQNVPVFSIDSSGNVQTQYQDLETSISVVPTIVEYNAEMPEKSLVRIDVVVKVSIISGERVLKGVSAPEYSVKTLTTTRVLQADNQSNVVGTFVSDTNIKTVSGIPFLGKIPLLKYFFSQEDIEKQRDTAVLTLGVRILPLPSVSK